MEENIFNQKFESLANSHEITEQTRTKFVEGLNELNNLRRVTANSQSELARLESQVSDLKLQNRKTRESLMMSLITRDQLNTKKIALANEIEQLEQQLDNLDKESISMLNDNSIEQAYERYATSNQLSLIQKLQEARCKLRRYEN